MRIGAGLNAFVGRILRDFSGWVYVGKGVVYMSGLNRSHGLIDSQNSCDFDILFIAHLIVETRPGPKIWKEAQVSLGSLSCEHPTYTR